MPKYIFFITLMLNGFNLIAEDPLKIGVVVPLTGNAAAYGQDIKNGLLFANQELANGKYQFEFVDDRCNNREAVNAVKYLIENKKVQYLLGFGCSGPLLAAAPQIEKTKIITISSSASAAAVSQAGEYIFRTWKSDAAAGATFAKHIASKHKNLTVLSEQTDYAQGFLNSLIFSNQDLQIKNENFLTDQNDFRTILLKLKASAPEALFVNSQTEVTFLNIVKQLRASNWSLPIYAAYWPGSAVILNQAADQLEGIEFVDGVDIDQAILPEQRQVYDKFVSQFGQPASINLMFISTFESFRAIHLAQQAANPLEFLYQNKFQGLWGEWYFDRQGDLQGQNFVIKKIQAGKVVLLTK